MKKSLKRVLALIMALAITVCMAVSASAASNPQYITTNTLMPKQA